MQFQPFNLGQVLQTAEAIKGARRQSTTDLLQQRYMAQDAELKAARESREAQTFTEEQKRINTEWLVGATDQILAAAERGEDPNAISNTLVPEAQRRGILPANVNTADGIDINEIRRMNQEMRIALGTVPKQDPGRMVQTIDEDGSVVFTPESEAGGKRPFTGQEPSSIREYEYARKQGFTGSYQEFERSRRGRGMSMTLPDGTTVQIGGDGSEISAGDLTSPVRTSLQQSIVTATTELDRLNTIGSGFDPQFLQIPGRLRGATLKLKDLAGGVLGNLSPEESDYLRRLSTFQADTTKNLSLILNQLSGAAISPAEADRLKMGIPNDSDTPQQFMAKYQAAVKDATRAVMRANWALKNGIGVRSIEQLSRSMPLHAIDQVYEQRANQIWQELGGTPESRSQAIKQANQEFGRE